MICNDRIYLLGENKCFIYLRLEARGNLLSSIIVMWARNIYRPIRRALGASFERRRLIVYTKRVKNTQRQWSKMSGHCSWICSLIFVEIDVFIQYINLSMLVFMSISTALLVIDHRPNIPTHNEINSIVMGIAFT